MMKMIDLNNVSYKYASSVYSAKQCRKVNSIFDENFRVWLDSKTWNTAHKCDDALGFHASEGMLYGYLQNIYSGKYAKIENNIIYIKACSGEAFNNLRRLIRWD